MVIVIAVTFIVSWSPQYLVTIISQLQTDSFLRESNFLFTMLMTHLFGFLNSCMNPFIYSAMSQRFRRSFKEVIYGILCCCFRKTGIPSRFLVSSPSSNRCHFTSTLRHGASETDNNTIALNDCLPNSSYIIRKGGSKSSSSGGTESDKLSFTKDNKIKTSKTALKDKSSYEQASPTDSETHLPLIQHSVSNGRCCKELKGILKNSPTQKRDRDYSTCVDCNSLHADSPKCALKKQLIRTELDASDVSINQQSVCLLQEQDIIKGVKYTNHNYIKHN